MKRVRPSKSLGEKSCEIKGGRHEMLHTVDVDDNRFYLCAKVIINIYYNAHHCDHFVTTVLPK